MSESEPEVDYAGRGGLREDNGRGRRREVSQRNIGSPDEESGEGGQEDEEKKRWSMGLSLVGNLH